MNVIFVLCRQNQVISSLSDGKFVHLFILLVLKTKKTHTHDKWGKCSKAIIKKEKKSIDCPLEDVL